ncbi:MAG: hypothetical protein AAF363_07700 [Bacteroidota bacterium]
MEGTIKAVITGDIIGSTRIVGDYKEALHKIGRDIKKHQDDTFIMDIYRGDSFQAISARPGLGLLSLLIIKAGLKRHSTTTGSKKTQWDARMSVGIGPLDHYPANNDLSEMTGEPFTISGRGLDSMKEKGRHIKAKTGIEDFDQDLEAIMPMIELITDRWSTSQADVVYHALLQPGLTQTEIGKTLGKTQKAVSKSLIISNIEAVEPFLKRFSEKVQWIYKK